MPKLNLPIAHEGALVDVEIGWSRIRARQLRLAHQPIPPPVQVQALIDTGAEVSCLDETLAQQLGLPLGGFTFAHAPALSGLTFSPQYDASLRLLHPQGQHLTLSDIFLLELPLGTLGYQAVVGRDVLARCRLVYEGPAGTFELAW